MKTLLTLVSCAAVFFSLTLPSSSNHDQEIINLVKDLSVYKKVNAKPSLMDPPMVFACAQAGPSNDSPHMDRYITVYTNTKGWTPMMAKKNPVFPEGTVIIKEKFAIDGKGQPKKTIELYTLMIKRKKGYNPACGDWEFASVKGNYTNPESGLLKKCIDCHKDYAKTDFVTRENYLSQTQRKKLK